MLAFLRRYDRKNIFFGNTFSYWLRCLILCLIFDKRMKKNDLKVEYTSKMTHNENATWLPIKRRILCVCDSIIVKCYVISREKFHRIAYNIVFQGTVNHKEWDVARMNNNFKMKYQSNKKSNKYMWVHVLIPFYY